MYVIICIVIIAISVAKVFCDDKLITSLICLLLLLSVCAISFIV